MAGAAGTPPGRDAVRRPAQAWRCDRRHLRERRSRARRDRNGHAHRRRSRLRVRSSDVQPRSDRISDDARLRLHGPAEPVLVGEALGDERSDRHVHAGSRHGDRRPPRPGAEPAPGHDDARIGSRRQAHVQVRRRARSAVHAADDVHRAREHAWLLRAAVRHGDLRGRGQGASEEIRRGLVRQSVRRRQLAFERLGLRRRADFGAHQQRLRERGHRQPRSDDQVDRGAAHGDRRARVARRHATARRTDGAAQSAAAHVSRRRPAADDSDRDSGECERHARGDGVGRSAAFADRTA